MKNLVLVGWMLLVGLVAGAQEFKKGDVVEIDRNLSDKGEYAWITGAIVDVDLGKKQYVVRSREKKMYSIPFIKEDRWIRRPVQPLTTAMLVKDDLTGCPPSFDLVQQKIREEFEADFTGYDSISITYNNIEALASYKNTDAGFGRPETDVFPFNVDFTVRLVNTASDGTQKKINWQFKRKYLLHQNLRGKCSLSLAEKEENLLSNI